MVSGKTDQHIVVIDPKGEEWPRRVSRDGDFVFDPTYLGGRVAGVAGVERPGYGLGCQPHLAAQARRRAGGHRRQRARLRRAGLGDPAALLARTARHSRTCLTAAAGGTSGSTTSPPARASQLIHDEAEQGAPTWGPGGQRYAWSPDGKQIAVIRSEAGASGVYIVSVEVGSLKPRGPLDGSVQAVAWSPRGDDRLAIIWGRADVPTCLGTIEASPKQSGGVDDPRGRRAHRIYAN